MKRESRNEIEKGREHNETGTHKYCNCPEVGGGKLTVIDWHGTLSDPLDGKNIRESESLNMTEEFLFRLFLTAVKIYDICIKIKQTFYFSLE